MGLACPTYTSDDADICTSSTAVGEVCWYGGTTANAEQFMTEEQVVLEALTLSRNDFFDQVQVDEQALQALYEREIGNLTEQRRASHILVEVTDEKEEESVSWEAAQP